MSGITPDTKLRLRRVTARFLNCNKLYLKRILTLDYTYLIVIVFKPAILTAPAPRTS